MAVKILLTGFEPFGGDERNPSLDAVRIVEKQFAREDAQLVVTPLAVEFSGAKSELEDLISRHNPDITISVGLAAGRLDLTFERVAINLADARIPDNAGEQPVDAPLVAGGPSAHFTTLPIKRAVNAVKDAGLRAAVSYTAGTYVCNAAMFHILHTQQGSTAQGGFIHVPDAYGTDAPMSVEEIAQGITIALHAFVDAYASEQGDLNITMGTEF